MNNGEKGHIIDNFPDKFVPRNAQTEIINGIEKAIKRGKKYIFVQAPTGVGKSAISIAVGRYFDGAYICTSQKSLQNQYTTEFPEIKRTWGRKNFKCLEQYDPKLQKDKNISCDAGLCVQDYDCERKPTKTKTEYVAGSSASRGTLYWQSEDLPRCQYWNDKMTCLNAAISCHNYKYLLTESRFVGDFGKRTVLIADEGHNIESNIIDMIKVEITNKTLNLINKYSDEMVKFQGVPQNLDNYTRLMIYLEWVESIYSQLPFILTKVDADVNLYQRQISMLKHLRGTEQKQYLINNLDDITRIAISSGKRVQAGEKRRENVVLKPSDITQEDLQIWVDLKSNRLSELGKEKERLEDLKGKAEFLLGDIKNNPKWVVMETHFPDKNIKSVCFQPLTVKQYAEEFLFKLGETIIIMSATILNPKKISHDLGIPKNEYKYISVEPQFSKESNEIYNLAIATFETNMEETQEEIETFWKCVIEKIDLILYNHASEKGIIHGNTHEICRKIKQYSKYSDRILIHSDSEERDNLDYRQQKIDEHCRSDAPTVLCSPSMAEGVDLYDDLSRFQILVKIPYPDVGNEWIRARMEADMRYFKMKTAVTICQAIGRSVRNQNDWCITYTLDSRFKDYMEWDPKLTELFNRHERPLTDLSYLWKNNKMQLDKLRTKIPRREKKRRVYRPRRSLNLNK
ncbi:MAG: helicase C-terminal domain-containing protein [Methanosarcinaceae archaeon]